MVEFDGGKTYYLQRRDPAVQEASVLLRTNVSLEGNGCELSMRANAAHIGSDYAAQNAAYTNTSLTMVVTGAVTYGTYTLTVDSTSGFSVGEIVVVRLVQDDDDPAESVFVTQATITAMTSTTVTFDKPMLTTATTADLTASLMRNKIVAKLINHARNLYVRNFRLSTPLGISAASEGAIFTIYTQNVLLESLHMDNCNAFVIGNPENLVARSCGGVNMQNEFNHPAHSRIWSIWGADGCFIDSSYGRDWTRCFAFVEFYSRGVHFTNTHVIDNHPDRLRTTWGIFHIANEGDVTFENTWIEGEGGSIFITTGAASDRARYNFRNTSVRLSSPLHGLPALKHFSGDFTYQVAGSTTHVSRNTSTRFSMDRAREYTYYIPLTDNQTFHSEYFGDPGLILWYSIYASSNITPTTHLSSLYFGHDSNTTGDLRSSLIPGSYYYQDVGLGSNWFPYNEDYTKRALVAFQTAATGVTSTPEKFLIVTAMIAPYEGSPVLALTSTEAKRRHGIA